MPCGHNVFLPLFSRFQVFSSSRKPIKDNQDMCDFLDRVSNLSLRAWDATALKLGQYANAKKLLLVVLLIGAPIALWGIAYPSGNTRYKITVTVETPEGIKVGSAVRSYHVQKTPEPLETIHPHTSMKGEAVVVDLGKRGVVFAVMGTDDYWLLFNTYPYAKGAMTAEGIRYYRSFKGGSTSLALKDRPLMVMFKDVKDPKTVTPVYRVSGTPIPNSRNYKYTVEDRFEEIFGKGVKLKDITIETTNEPVTWGIEKQLPWIPFYYNQMLDGLTHNTIKSEHPLANSLASGSFSTGE